MSIGIERAHYVALSVDEPEKAAAFAVEELGFAPVHQDGHDHYLRAHGSDPYSLVYRKRASPESPEIDHVSYLVRTESVLAEAASHLEDRGVAVERIAASPLWKHAGAVRFSTPSGHRMELTTGIHVDIPMAAGAQAPDAPVAPICLDHIVTRNIDPATEFAFALDTLGLRESARILAPDGNAVLSFARARTIFHCYAVAQAGRNGLHHFQLTMKNPESLYAAHEAMAANGVEILWGPLRHGPGHNIAFYVRDGSGFIVEYSTEEELILDDETYQPRQWSVTDQKSADEWGTQIPETFFAD